MTVEATYGQSQTYKLLMVIMFVWSDYYLLDTAGAVQGQEHNLDIF